MELRFKLRYSNQNCGCFSYLCQLCHLCNRRWYFEIEFGKLSRTGWSVRGRNSSLSNATLQAFVLLASPTGLLKRYLITTHHSSSMLCTWCLINPMPQSFCLLLAGIWRRKTTILITWFLHHCFLLSSKTQKERGSGATSSIMLLNTKSCLKCCLVCLIQIPSIKKVTFGIFFFFFFGRSDY